MEKLTTKKKLAAVRLYLSGMSYDEIAAKTGISKGMVAKIVAELKAGGFPEAADVGEQIQVLRELSLDLKHSGLVHNMKWSDGSKVWVITPEGNASTILDG